MAGGVVVPPPVVVDLQTLSMQKSPVWHSVVAAQAAPAALSATHTLLVVQRWPVGHGFAVVHVTGVPVPPVLVSTFPD